MARTLVTGGAGFIGSHVVRELIRLGHDVTVLDDLSGGFQDNIPGEASFVEGSIVDNTLVDHLFKEQTFEIVYHLAAYAAEGLSHFIRRFNYTNNVIGSVNLINAAVKYDVRAFVFTSSIAVYGAAQTPMTETTAPHPEDPYGIAKFAVELDLAAAYRIFGLPFVVFRPHNVYGEFQNLGDRYRNVVGIFMNQVMLGQPMTVFGDGNQRRAFTYIGDIAPVIAAAPFVPEARCQVFNLGADVPVTVNELAVAVSEAFGVATKIEYLPPRQEVYEAYSEHSKVERVFGRAARTPLRDGIARMARWAQSVGPRRSRGYMEVEVARNLPAAWRHDARAEGVAEDAGLVDGQVF